MKNEFIKKKIDNRQEIKRLRDESIRFEKKIADNNTLTKELQDEMSLNSLFDIASVIGYKVTPRGISVLIKNRTITYNLTNSIREAIGRTVLSSYNLTVRKDGILLTFRSSCC